MIRIVQAAGDPLFYQRETRLPSYIGVVQWNGVNKQFEVSTGSGWASIDNTVNLQQNPEVEKVFMWARDKMREEQRLKELAKTNAAVADLLKNMEQLQAQIKMVENLIQ